MKKFLFIITIAAFTFSNNLVNAQHLFSVIHNDLSKENVAQLKNQITQSEISTLSMTRNNEDRNVYTVSLSSIKNMKIIILNEHTGNHVTIIPVEESRAEFLLAPFFIEELRQGALGDATRYVILEITPELIVRNAVSVSVSNEEVYIPKFFYGKKEDVKEALPTERQIVHIFKQKPRLILAYYHDPELLSYAEQYEEENSYYVFMYKLPDGSLCIYDEHFNPDNGERGNRVGEQLQFDPTYINMDQTKITATEYAFSLWGEKLVGEVPIDISIEFKNLGGGGIIGQSFHMQSFFNSTQVPTSPANTWYHAALWNQLRGYDVTSGKDIKLEMNTNFNFYFGITGNPSYSQIDWITVMLHEINHGLGFAAFVGSDGRYFAVTDPEGGYGNYTGSPGIFDRQLFQGTTGPCLTELTQTERAALVKSNNLYSGAPESFLLAAHGNRVRMYAPTSYQSGSSVSHWNNSPGFTTFMTPGISQGWKFHTITTREIGILRDLGWKIYDPNAIFINCYPNEGEGNMPQQQFSIGVMQYLKANTFTKQGYTFKDWNTSADGTGTTYQDKQLVSFTDNTDLYAQWEDKKYTLSFNPNNGTVNPTSIQVTYKKPIGELPIPERLGYAFKGWRIGATIIDEEFVWEFEDNKTADASWEMITHTITATATSGGTISPSGDAKVLEGTNKTYNIKPLPDYFIDDVLVDDESVGAVPKYVFENVVASHTIHAIFSGLGVKENKDANSVRINPNPTTGQIKVENSKFNVQSVEIFDVFGRKLNVECRMQNAEWVIDISEFTAGIYLIKIQTEKGMFTKKIIKL